MGTDKQEWDYDKAEDVDSTLNTIRKSLNGKIKVSIQFPFELIVPNGEDWDYFGEEVEDVPESLKAILLNMLVGKKIVGRPQFTSDTIEVELE